MHSSAAWLSEAGALYGDCVQQLGEALPADAPPFPTTAIEPRKRTFHGPVKEAMEGVGVAMDSRVAVVTSQPSLEAVEEGFPRQVPVRLNLFLDPFARTLQFLASSATFDTRHARSVFFPEKFEAQKGEPPRHARMKATEAPDAGLLR